MRLFLLRHAEAEDDAPSDAARRLTKRGFEQAWAVGQFCARMEIAPQLVLFSPYIRAEQTTRMFAEACPSDNRLLQPAPFAGSGMDPETGLRELRAFERFAGVMLVGHQPDLGLMAAMLLGTLNKDAVAVGKATLIGLNVSYLGRGGGSLAFQVPAEMMT